VEKIVREKCWKYFEKIWKKICRKNGGVNEETKCGGNVKNQRVEIM
jgi:hypothetical protein